MTTTATPVWSMPRPGMLPSGMPLPAEPDETQVTILHEDELYGNAILWVSRRLTPKLVREEIHGNPTQRKFDRLFDEALEPYAPSPWLEPRQVISQESVTERIEALRSLLHITAEAVASIVGLGERRYYELRSKTFPSVRLAEIANRVSIIGALASRDWQTMRALITGRRDELTDLLDRSRFAELRELFERTRDERNYLLVGGRIPDLDKFTIERPREVSGILDAPVFDEVAKVIARIGRIDGQIRNRSKAFVEVAETFAALDEEGAIGENWDFLLGLDAAERIAFRERAEAFIQSEGFIPEGWQAFLTEESDRAWNTAAPVRLEPVNNSVFDYAEEETSASSWEPDLSSMGIDFSLLERR